VVIKHEQTNSSERTRKYSVSADKHMKVETIETGNYAKNCLWLQTLGSETL
jgi:hypothetical protein